MASRGEGFGARPGAAGDAPGTEARDPAYFGYYAQLTHQQNMLQDTVRTSTYHSAIVSNAPMFADKVVMDVGAGSGILSYFAVQAGARKVWAVEASNMAEKMKRFLSHAGSKNVWLRDKIQVIQGKIEDESIPIPPQSVDIIISEPIGVLLVHERMLESFLFARDRYLKPTGAVFPSDGTIFLAPFTDASLWTQTMAKVRFWDQNNFYGVDLSPLSKEAKDEIFGMPVVGTFDPRTLLSPPSSFAINFRTITIPELQEFTVPINWTPNFTGIIHGIAGWFDIGFVPPAGTASPVAFSLTTSPHAERTHWHQIRLLLREPLAVNALQTVRGWLHMAVNDMRSYTMEAELVLGDEPLSDPAQPAPPPGRERTSTRRRETWQLQDQTYYYGYDPSLPNNQDYQPEYSCLYSPEIEAEGETADPLDELVQSSAGDVDLAMEHAAAH
ncbi:S-adenosyl-L-methionine-dependent methyltransferase [Hyaloraphidium curvatum]|nr:S-adenosyl-L-methionine-dependent methyltransferase [Hyaloraphidium curvatum]